jgi:hypothetical protein
MNVSLFNAIAPEYASLGTDEAARRDLIALSAAGEIDAETFGTRYDTALCLLTAHYLKQSEQRGTGGFQTGETVGDLSRSFEKDDFSGTDLGSTSYGEQFLRLRKQLVKSPLWVAT